VSRPPGGPVVRGNLWHEVPDALPDDTTVSVVVTHYEQQAELDRTLDAIARQTFPAARLEVVVADDGSSEAPRVPPGVSLVRQEDRGFRAAAARNLGARHTSGDVLVFLDADTAPEPDFVAHLARLPAVLPEAVVVGRRRHVDLATGTILADPLWLLQGHANSRDLLDADETSFRYVISAVLACSRWFFEETGGFDETFSTYGGEDWEWAHRAWTHGALLAHEARAVAWHDGPDRAGRAQGDEVGDAARMLSETLAIARRVPVPGVAPTGLLLGPPDPVVTIDPTLPPDAVVVTADDLLASMPRAQLVLADHHALLLRADQRVHAVGSTAELADHAAARSAWRWLHVHAPVTGSADGWRVPGDLLRGPGAPGRVEVVDPEGRPLLVWHSLRAVRRAARWSRDDLDPVRTVVADGLAALAPDVEVAARWGGWA